MSQAVQMVTRFAPSPTGLLHLGHAVSAYAGWAKARAAGGRFLLRLEDIDAGRCKPEFAAGILQDLAWLGLDWDGDVRVQSAHMAQYQDALENLIARGLVYPCFCSRAEITRALRAPHGKGSLYPGTCRGLGKAERAARMAAGMAYALRLDCAQAMQWAGALKFFEESQGWVTARPEQLGDVVLARRDVPVSYHLCVVHDDALQGVTHVTRGMDLLESTHIHVLLQKLWGWATPAYAHHALLTDATGQPLAKRRGEAVTSLAAMREAGMDGQAVLRHAMELAG